MHALTDADFDIPGSDDHTVQWINLPTAEVAIRRQVEEVIDPVLFLSQDRAMGKRLKIISVRCEE
jgi:hypothetical protein